jgi:hypothetical protein
VNALRGKHPRPRVFIGSSKEGLRIAEFIQLGLYDEVEAVIWRQGVFGLSEVTFESLEQATRDFDFAVLVLTPDDVRWKRGRQKSIPRDNLLFELGLFMGSMGRERTFIVRPGDEPLDLPSDLAGIIAATYVARSAADLAAAMGPVCTQIKGRIRQSLGMPDPARSGSEEIEEKSPLVARRRRRRSLGTASTVGPKRTHRVVDISVSGALLETDGELPVGQLLELDLKLDDRSRARVTGKVVRVQEPQWGLVGGVGVAFTQYNADSRSTIEAYVNADRKADPPTVR